MAQMEKSYKRNKFFENFSEKIQIRNENAKERDKVETPRKCKFGRNIFPIVETVAINFIRKIYQK